MPIILDYDRIEIWKYCRTRMFVYYDFDIKKEFAIQSFGENKFKGDDVVIETEKPTHSQSISITVDNSYKDIEMGLNETNKIGFIDMSRPFF